MALGLGFSQNSGNSSSRTLTIIPQGKYRPGLSSLYVTIPLHFSKLAGGVTGKSLEFSRQQLLSGYADTDWPTLLSYCVTVFEKKGARLYGHPTEAEYLSELENCRSYYTEARRTLLDV